MKKIIISFVCAMIMTLGIAVEPALALESENTQETTAESVSETVLEALEAIN